MSYMAGTNSLSLYSFGFSDPTILDSMPFYSDPELLLPFSSSSLTRNNNTTSSSSSHTNHRHDGTSPLPLGMDWSPPPSTWDGRNTIWLHDPSTGWSYCVTIPSWTVLPSSGGSDPVVFYRVQVAIQSPRGITTIRGILRRFNDFMKLFSDLKSVFPKKNFPPAPPRKLLRRRNKDHLEERRCALEDWMEKLLSDIDLSRNVHVAIFLELEAAVRSSFDDSNPIVLDENSPVDNVVPYHFPTDSNTSSTESSSLVTTDFGKDSAHESSEVGVKDNDFKVGVENSSSNLNLAHELGKTHGDSLAGKVDGQLKNDSVQGFREQFPQEKPFRRDDSVVDKDDITASKSVDLVAALGLDIPSDFLVALPAEERHKISMVLITMQQRLATANTDREDLMGRLNQELAVKQYLTTKVKELEVELETNKWNEKENLQQAIINERDKLTQMQWDTEDFRKKCMELELKVKSEQDEKMLMESRKVSIIQQNELLQQDLNVMQEKLESLLKHQEELELEPKSDVQLLMKEVDSLRNSQLELKDEVSRLMNEKLEAERALNQDKQRSERANANNMKLLHECKILRNRLEECGVSFLIEGEDKWAIDTLSPTDAIDLLTTADNQIGLLLTEAQLLSEDVVNNIAADDLNINSSGNAQTLDDELRQMMADIFIDNARLRKQVNSVIRWAFSTAHKSDDKHDPGEELSSKQF